jgi:predicted small lipoprotein YifL
LQRFVLLRRSAALAAVLMALTGCYNPRFPSEAPGAASTPDTGQDHVVRDRRDTAAGSGSSSSR